ncbi:MAG TPA: patatin-like phospholipase family protein, partial [Arenimonas sp.]|nr:patatin-like phospholipase family protein [Arenimonas sp.]
MHPLLPGQTLRQPFPQSGRLGLVHSADSPHAATHGATTMYPEVRNRGLQSTRPSHSNPRMIVLQPAKSLQTSQARIGLAIAGGGPIGGMYELGALRALERAIEGIDLTRLEVYVGVSSGAFIASALANGIDTAEMCRIFLTGDSRDVRFRPEIFLRPAFGEYAKRATAIPKLALRWWRDLLCDPTGAQASELLGRLSEAIPTGIFDNRGIERFMRAVFSAHGRSNDFRKLARKLYVIAVDLDSGEAVRFGSA